MAKLAEHFARVRRAHAHDRLLILFEIDGVIEQRLAGHRPNPGVLDVIRWFQLQPNTFVGINSGRSGRLRDETLRSLNAMGRSRRVEFDSNLVRLNESGADGDVVASKIEGMRAFARGGYRAFAIVDNDPIAIRALVDADDTGEILFLHARTPTTRRRASTPRTVGGRVFDLTALIGEGSLPDQVQLVWHGVNDERNLGEFLASLVGWGECDVRRDPAGRLVLRHDSFERTPWTPDEPVLTLATAVEAFAERGRGLKLDLKDGPDVLGEVLALIGQHRLDDQQLWFNAAIETVGAEGFRTLRSARPGSVLQCPIDFLAPLVMVAPARARAVVRMLAGWGITRWSVGWGFEHTRSLVDRLEAWGYEVNIYAVPDHESFLQAVLLLPRSLTADFNFPGWNYYGRGSGERRRYHSYRTRKMKALATAATSGVTAARADRGC